MGVDRNLGPVGVQREVVLIGVEEYSTENAADEYIDSCYELGYSCRKYCTNNRWVVEVYTWA